MPGVRSVVVLGVGYGKREEFSPDDKPRGLFSKMAVGRDYHRTIMDLLSKLDSALRGVSPPGTYESAMFTDNGPLLERGFAMRAGLGWRGKNGNIINDRLGSFFNIGLLLTNLPIEPDRPIPPTLSLCGRCRACVDACPGGAISDAGLNHLRCVSFLTQTKSLPPESERLLGNMLYGCDICQDVCPHNALKYTKPIYDINASRPAISDLISISGSQFRKLYHDTAIAWRGAPVLRRNAAVALKNLRPWGAAPLPR
jgi:epoxyqueuosine reductase